MMDETLTTIQRFTNERLQLYMLAGHQHLSPDQQRRLEELNAKLPVLWDHHRREYASQTYHVGYSRPIRLDNAA